jgi:hypothetical protein
MGRHSRGAGESPPPLPDPPTRHPYAPRSPEDTGTWDRSTYRVVDVGLPSQPSAGGPAARPPLRSVPEFDGPPSRFGAAESATRQDTASRLRRPDPSDTGPRLRPPDPADTGSRLRPADTGSRLRPPDLTDTGSRLRRAESYGVEASVHGATRADLYESRYGAEPPRRPADPYDRLEPPRYGATRADLADPRLRPDGAGPRYGATRADLAESVGSTALAARPAPDPDEVSDTGARRARSAFHLAPEADEAHESDYETDYEPDYGPDYDDPEPSLLLQWGIFLAQTLTGALAGIGIWLGFYRLWSTWPFYAVPSVGVAAIGMLVLARTLRRRHGHDLDLLTAIVTVGVITVLTVLPAAFTLQDLSQ